MLVTYTRFPCLPTKTRFKNKVSEQEWQLRVDLAACYRLLSISVGGFNLHPSIGALTGTDHYLVNAFGLSFDEVTASNLVKVDLAGNILDDTPFKINPAGFTIHSAIHEVRDDAHCVIHLHTKENIGNARKRPLPLSQYSMFSLPSLSYHGYEGLAVNSDEKKRLQDD